MSILVILPTASGITITFTDAVKALSFLMPSFSTKVPINSCLILTAVGLYVDLDSHTTSKLSVVPSSNVTVTEDGNCDLTSLNAASYSTVTLNVPISL